MDSFYDAPRRPPQPFVRETLTATPLVPEISVLGPSNIPRNAFTPYNQWKMQQNSTQHHMVGANKENFSGHSSNGSILKKQVRFESPKLYSMPANDGRIRNDYNTVKQGMFLNNQQTESEKPMPNFEQIYMANIPNRKLDLSIIDSPKKAPVVVEQNDAELNSRESDNKAEIKEDIRPNSYKEFLAQRVEPKIVLNDSVTDIFNYKRGNVKCASPKLETNHQFKMYNDKIQKNTDIQSKDVLIHPNKTERFDSSNNIPVEKLQNPPYIHSNFENIQLHKNIVPEINYYSRSVQDNPAIYEPNSNYSRPVQHISVIHEPNLHRQTHTSNMQEFYKTDPRLPYNNLLRNLDPPSLPQKSNCCCGGTANTENLPVKTKSDDEVSVKDLLKIISQQSQQITQQNEQLILLQKQISTLISRDNEENVQKTKSIEFSKPRYCIDEGIREREFGNERNKDEKYITSTQHEEFREPQRDMTPKKNKVSNFSIGVMTSFEVSINNPQNRNGKNKVGRQVLEPPKIQEITEIETTNSDKDFGDENKFPSNFSDNNKTLADVSMTFKEPIKVRESCPSPEPSIKITMNDFEDSDSEDDCSSEIAPMFYNNLMTQVNKILQKAQIQTKEEMYNFQEQNGQHIGKKLKNETIHKVKEATLNHLRNIGVEVPNLDQSSSCSSDDTGDQSYNQEDISYTVKQLLMKYLPDEYLAKISKRANAHQNPAMLTPKEKVGAIKNRPEFSFATVQYMKKYNLISNGKREHRFGPETPNKILDLTKLKQQPKLL